MKEGICVVHTSALQQGSRTYLLSSKNCSRALITLVIFMVSIHLVSSLHLLQLSHQYIFLPVEMLGFFSNQFSKCNINVFENAASLEFAAEHTIGLITSSHAFRINFPEVCLTLSVCMCTLSRNIL